MSWTNFYCSLCMYIILSSMFDEGIKAWSYLIHFPCKLKFFIVWKISTHRQTDRWIFRMNVNTQMYFVQIDHDFHISGPKLRSKLKGHTQYRHTVALSPALYYIDLSTTTSLMRFTLFKKRVKFNPFWCQQN